MNITIPDIKCDNKTIEKAYNIAIGDLVGNIKNYKAGLLEEEKSCLMAGMDYGTPWTRDTAINVWNSIGIMCPEIAKNTLLSVCDRDSEGNDVIGIGFGQYWDCIIWTMGAYEYAVVNNDINFQKFIYKVTLNTLKKYEVEEFDSEKNLFYGPAVYGDGIASYPDKYADTQCRYSGIFDWPKFHPELKRNNGSGQTMYALSTNCVYYMAYKICATIGEKLGIESKAFRKKADKLKEAVNKYFWNEETGRYDYLAFECDHQEGVGLSLVILSGIADGERATKTIENTYVTEHSIACVWPAFERYLNAGGLGRHSGTVWPFIQGMWGRALLKNCYYEKFDSNLMAMAEKAVRDGQFYEIYHSITGEIYGGLQERTSGVDANGQKANGIVLWKSMRRQSWSASAYLSLVYYGILGLEYSDEGLKIKPYLPSFCNEITVKDIPYKSGKITITVKRDNKYPEEILLSDENLNNSEIILCG